MIHSKSSRLMIHGIGQQAATRYKAPDGMVKQGSWMVADGRGGGKQPGYVLGCYDAPYGVAYATAALASTASYDLTGEVIPAVSTVYLSRAGYGATPEELEAGVIATVQSDDTGAWSYEGLEGFDGTLWAWIKVTGAVLDALDAGVSCDMTVSIHETEDEVLQHVILGGIAPNEDAYPTITITGARPEAVTVYVSTYAPDDALTVEALTPQVISSAAAEAGNYSITFDGAWDQGYVVWCQSELPGLTASMTYTSQACLAGGTLITMADGSRKRLDEVRPGDLLLAGDGTTTRALRVARGRWNDYHTLYRFEDGAVIDEIHDHRFYNCEAGFWQLLRRWHIGDHARRQDGAEVALVSVERVDEPAEMFGLWTASRDYWANGLLSGETAANQALLADATAEQAAEMMASLEERAILQLLGGLEDLLP